MANKLSDEALKFSSPQLYQSHSKRPGSPLVFFVHFYGGHQRVMRRHIQLINDLGFDVFIFNLPSRKNLSFKSLLFPVFGLKHIYAEMIAHFLDKLPGPKVIFSFSNPSASAIEAIAKHRQKNEIWGLICDSGPSAKFMKSAWNLAIHQQQSPWLMLFFSFFWSPNFHFDLKQNLRSFPKGFPILSIQPQKDPVIPPDHIESVFSGLDHLSLTVSKPQEAGHLNALKLSPALYRAEVENFLLKLLKEKSVL